MKRRRRRTGLPLMTAELALASWEVIARRSLMMMQGSCAPAEYQRMLAEKISAAQHSAATLAAAGGRVSTASLLAPWHRAVTANAKRLRRR